MPEVLSQVKARLAALYFGEPCLKAEAIKTWRHLCNVEQPALSG